jgi:hypothetical protein
MLIRKPILRRVLPLLKAEHGAERLRVGEEATGVIPFFRQRTVDSPQGPGQPREWLSVDPVNPLVESGPLPSVRVPERDGSEHMLLELPPTTGRGDVTLRLPDARRPRNDVGVGRNSQIGSLQCQRSSAKVAAFAGFASVLVSPRLVAGSLVVVVAVLAVFGPTRNVIASAGNELAAMALFASTVSVLDGFRGIVDAVLFDMFTPRPLLFAARSLLGSFRSHGNLSGRGCKGIVTQIGRQRN